VGGCVDDAVVAQRAIGYDVGTKYPFCVLLNAGEVGALVRMLQGVSYDEASEQMQGLQMQCIMAKGLHVIATSNQRAHDTFAWSKRVCVFGISL